MNDSEKIKNALEVIEKMMEIDFVVVVDAALWFIPEYPRFLR